MGASPLLCLLRRLRGPPATVLACALQNHSVLSSRGGDLLFPFMVQRRWRQFSSCTEIDVGGHPEKGTLSKEGEEIYLGGQVLSSPLSEDGEDSTLYSPVCAVISLLDGYHDFTGFPWWITIATSTLALRISLLPVLLLQFKKMRKISELLPNLPPPLPPPFSGKSFKEQFLLFRKKRLELSCPSYLWNFVFVTVQLPCFFLWMTSIRRMSLDNHIGFEQGGILWFQNLTEFPHGPFGSIFPILVAGLHFINVQISFQNIKLKEMPGMLGLLSRYYKIYLDILSLPLLLVGFNIPQGSLVYWVTNSSFTLIQQLCLRNPFLRNKLGLSVKTSVNEPKKHEKSHMLEQNISAQQICMDHLSAEQLLQLALNHMNVQCPDEALPLLRLAIGKDPGNVKALIALGQISCSKGFLEEAAEYFELALSKTKEEAVSDLVLASFGAGFSRLNQGMKEKGIEHLKRIAELKEPENPVDRASYYTGLVLLGSTLYNDGNKAEAARYLSIAATYDPAVNEYLKQCEQD